MGQDIDGGQQDCGGRRRRRDRQRAQQSDARTQYRQNDHRQTHADRGLMGSLGVDAARFSQEGDAEGLGETGGRQAADHGQGQDHNQRGQSRRSSPRLSGDRSERSGIDQEFTDEPVQGWQPRNRCRPDQKCRTGGSHAPDQAAQLLDVAGAGGMQNGTDPEKQQALENGVVEDMHGATQHAEGG